VECLKKPFVGCHALIDYRNYNPDDKRFHAVFDHGDYLESDNFVSSAYGFRREVFNKHGDKMKHDGWHKYLYKIGYTLTISKPDGVENQGFGKSVYVGSDGKAIKMENEPLIYEKN